MKTLHWYLLRQVLAATVMTVAVFTFVLLLGNVLKEVLSLLVNQQATLSMVFKVVMLLIPYVLVFALPMGLLTATLLVFGRLSADQELTAIRASGVSLIALISPVLLLSVLLAGVSAYINFELAPVCREAYRAIIREAGAKQALAFVQEKTVIRDLKDMIVYIDEVDGTNLTDVYVYELEPDGSLKAFLRAGSGTISVDIEEARFSVVLYEVWRTFRFGNSWSAAYSAISPLPEIELEQRSRRKTSISSMTMTELLRELEDVERSIGEWDVNVDSAPAMREVMSRMRRSKDDLVTPIKLQIHRLVSFSFACIGFTMVGIPLGIRAHRRETTFGIAFAILLLLLYYSFFIFGQALESHPEWGPQYILWLPNFIFQAVGVVLLRRANRGV